MSRLLIISALLLSACAAPGPERPDREAARGADASVAEPPSSRSCSIAHDEVIKIASWDLNGAFNRLAPASDALSELAVMIDMLDAEVLALQGVTPEAKEVTGALLRLREKGRCYQALVSADGYATLFDPQALSLLYAETRVLDCDGKAVVSTAQRTSAVEDASGEQISYFRAKSDGGPHAAAFDFLLLNVDIRSAGKDLARLAALYNRLDADYPWLSGEKDRIILGDLAIDGASLSRNHFPQTKPLINLLLKISLGLSDKTFDQAVAAARSPSGERDEFNDNILVRRWDHPGDCAETGYCGGLEEFIAARVYSPEKAGPQTLTTIGKAVHPPVAGRFCKFADSDHGLQASR